MRCIMALGAAFAVCMFFADDIFGFLVRPLTNAFPAGEGKLVYTKLYEACFVQVKIALFGSYGWGDGEWMRTWEESAGNAGAVLACDSVMANEEPDDEAKTACRNLGQALA